MPGQGLGEIWISEPEVLIPPLRYPISLGAPVSLLNFDIDVAQLKPEHKKCLNEKIIPALRMNPGSAISLTGHVEVENAISTMCYQPIGPELCTTFSTQPAWVRGSANPRAWDSR
jgi:hypothetical protein